MSRLFIIACVYETLARKPLSCMLAFKIWPKWISHALPKLLLLKCTLFLWLTRLFSALNSYLQTSISLFVPVFPTPSCPSTAIRIVLGPAWLLSFRLFFIVCLVVSFSVESDREERVTRYLHQSGLWLILATKPKRYLYSSSHSQGQHSTHVKFANCLRATNYKTLPDLSEAR